MKNLIIILLFIIFYACYHIFSQLLFAENNLVMIQGQLYKKQLTIDTIARENKITKCLTLAFGLKDDRRFYTIKLNIDSVYQGFNALGGVNLALENAGQVKVWIKKSELNSVRPKVYTLAVDDRKIFDQKEKPISNLKLYFILTSLALLFISIYFALGHYDKLSSKIGLRNLA